MHIDVSVHYTIRYGPLLLSWFSEVVPFNTWLFSSWEGNKCCYKMSKCTKLHLFHSKLSKFSFWVKIVVILSVAQLVTTVIFFSAWDTSSVKRDNSQISTNKMRTLDVKEHLKTFLMLSLLEKKSWYKLKLINSIYEFLWKGYLPNLLVST